VTGFRDRELMLRDPYHCPPKPTPLIGGVGIVPPLVVLPNDQFRQTQDIPPKCHAPKCFIPRAGFGLVLRPRFFDRQ